MRTDDGRSPLAGAQGPASREEEPAEAPRPGTAPERGALDGPETVPFASVIVVCWNVEDVLGRCLDQLLAQDYASYEVIVVDDGSKDRTVEVAERALSSGRLKIVRSPRNRGCPHARNLGLREAGGEIIAFIDADGFAAPDWLRRIVDAFASEASVGAVASTVFFAGNPLVINGAGGIVNRQGWAADMSMNESYERAEIAAEALYPMGCGMAVRRSAAGRVGAFDDRMLNYYDDVDYGMRLWRAGYRVLVAADAWIDHGFGGAVDDSAGARGDSARKQLLCERHRIRVVLKHIAPDTLARWARHEALALIRAPWSGRTLKLKAIAWNLRHLPSVLADRRRLRRAPRVPDRLIDPSWGDGFPAGVPALLTPRPQTAGSSIEMADPDSTGALLYGWFPLERVGGRSYRWAGAQAAVLVRLDAPVRRLWLDYAHAPVDTGGVDVFIRRQGAADPLARIWSTHLSWQYIERCVENHPLALPAGDYEVLFSARRPWTDPPLETRSLGFTLTGMSFEQSYEIAAGGLDMASSAVEQQLVSGWFEAEQSPARSYRWAGAHAAAVVRIAENVTSARLSYCFPPGPLGALKLTVRPLDQEAPAWSTRIVWLDTDWHEENFPLALAPGDYLLSFDAEATWSNPGQRDPALWAENRALGFALSSMSFRAT